MSAIINPYGMTTTLQYNSSNNLTQVTNPLSFSNQFDYFTGSLAGLMASMTDALGKTKYYTFDSAGKLATATDAKSGIKVLGFSTDYSGPVVAEASMTSPMGRVTTYRATDAYGDSITKENIFPSGLIVTEIKQNDDSKRTLSSSSGSSSSETYIPHPAFPNRMTLSQEDILSNGGGSSTFAESFTYNSSSTPYDFSDHTSATTLSATNTFVTNYHKASKTYTSTSPMGKVSQEILDSQGRTSEIQLPGILPITLQYNLQGQMSSLTQGTRSYIFTYNTAGLLQTLENPLSQSTSFVYDAAGQTTSTTLANSKIYQFAYNGNGDITSITNASSGVYSTTFDDNRNLALNTEPMVASTPFSWTYSHNADNQLTNVLRPDASNVALTYDTNGNLSSLTGTNVSRTYNWYNGAIQSIAATGNANFSVSGDTLPSSTTWSGAVAGSVDYSWGYQQLLGMTVNSTNSFYYTYDSDGELIQAQNLIYSRNATTGFIDSTDISNVDTVQSYDTYGTPSETIANKNNAEFLRLQYSRDALGRISSLSKITGGTTATTSYTYDSIGQLSSVTAGGTTTNYTYSNNGNRFTSGSPQTYDSHDRLVSDATWTYTYNKSGHLSRKDHVSNGTYVTYSYDALGNLLTVQFSSGTKVEYLVDGTDRRIRRKLNNAFSAAYIYSDKLRPIAQLNSNGSVKAYFIYGSKPNVPDLMVQSGVTYRIISDHLGSPLYVVRASNGTIAQQMTYDTWGNVLTDSSPGFQPFGFAGGIYDSTTGLVRFGARDYDASIGRWLNKDPIRFDGGFNLYGYVGNDPVNAIDPDGLKTYGSDPFTRTVLAALRKSGESRPDLKKILNMIESRNNAVILLTPDAKLIKGADSICLGIKENQVIRMSNRLPSRFNPDSMEMQGLLLHELYHSWQISIGAPAGFLPEKSPTDLQNAFLGNKQ